jgi:hypothetical protein
MAGLTKQHFKAIAEIINNKINLHKYNNSNKVLVLKELTEDLSNYFKTLDPLFNENQFKKACLK